MAYAADTSVPVERSRAEIERLLSKHKCQKFMAGIDNDAHRATVQFQAHGRIVRFEIALPDRNDPQFMKIKNRYMQRSVSGVEKAVAQAERTCWRALLLVIKAKLEAVESNIATFEDEFLAHTVLPNQQTVAQYIGPAVEQMYATGTMTPARLIAGETEKT